MVEEKKMPDLKGFSFSITNYCLCKCKHCLLGNDSGKKIFLKKDDILKICHDIMDYNIMTADKPIALTGGEISLHPDIIDIICGIHKMGFKKINISTTGMGFSEDNIKNIAPYINIASFSLDGTKDYHDWFRGVRIYEKTISCIKLFQKYGAKNVAIQMSVSNENYDMIEPLVKYAHDNKVSHVRIIPILPIGKAETMQEISLLNKQMYEKLHLKIMILNAKYSDMDKTSILDRKKFLLSNTERIYGRDTVDNMEVSADGSVHFCNMLDEKYSIGNIYTESILNIVQGTYDTEAYCQYNKMSHKIYSDISTDNNETICLLEERMRQ